MDTEGYDEYILMNSIELIQNKMIKYILMECNTYMVQINDINMTKFYKDTMKTYGYTFIEWDNVNQHCLNSDKENIYDVYLYID